MKKHFFTFDRVLFGITAALVVVGLFVFLSASFSASGNVDKWKGILFNQIALGLCGGIALFLTTLMIPYEWYKKYSIIFYVIGIILLILVFVPGVGLEHGGARRWLSIGGLSFQPVEFAKYATIMFLAVWLSTAKQKIGTLVGGLVPVAIIIGIIGVLLLAQPDTDSFLVIAGAGLAMYFLSGAKWRHIGISLLLVVILGAGLLFARPYLLDRVKVFLDPSRDAQGSSYQVQQQLIAVGSGGVTGRGFGQSIQKFKYLPEPLGDSIFAVVGEEFGFIGSALIIIIYILFFARGMMVAARTRDPFGKLLVVGIITLIVLQSFLNIASAIAVFPLGGLPLIFISHGGTALALALAAMGVVLNVSKKSV